jgi:shikimate kinase
MASSAGQKLECLEIIGVAGAGKSTVAGALAGRMDGLVDAARLMRSRPALRFAMIAFGGLKAYVTNMVHGQRGPRLTRLDAKDCAYLRQFRRIIQSPAPCGWRAILFDQGPLYRLARLYPYGHDPGCVAGTNAWWNDALAFWAKHLALVVLLDAPDAVLIERVAARPKGHPIKKLSPQQSVDFVRDFRHRYSQITNQLRARGSTRVLAFDTAVQQVETIAERVICELVSL